METKWIKKIRGTSGFRVEKENETGSGSSSPSRVEARRKVEGKFKWHSEGAPRAIAEKRAKRTRRGAPRSNGIPRVILKGDSQVEWRRGGSQVAFRGCPKGDWRKASETDETRGSEVEGNSEGDSQG